MKKIYSTPHLFKVSVEHAPDLLNDEEFRALMFLQRLDAAKQFREAMGRRIFRVTGL